MAIDLEPAEVPQQDADFEALLASEPTVLILRQNYWPSLSSWHGSYQWPGVGGIARPVHWDPRPVPGHGLHGWLWGQGDGVSSLLPVFSSVALVVRALERTVVTLEGSVKVPACRVEFVGTLAEAADWIVKQLPEGQDPDTVIGRVVTVDRYESAVTGPCGKATAGYCGTASAGDFGCAEAGDYGTARAGEAGQATAGDHGVAIVGKDGTAVAGNYGTAIAGHYGTATSGDSGTATAGDFGWAKAGPRGRVRAGYGGKLAIDYWDGKRYQTKTAAVGANGILPDVLYRLNSDGLFEAVEEARG
jgi:hypothetical protein